LRQSENLFADQSWYGNLNPVLVRPFVICAIAIRHAIALSQGSGDPLPWTDLSFAKTGSTSVGGIA
jgi:hypothetical protein